MLKIGLVQQSAWDLPIDSMPLAAGYMKAVLDADPDLGPETDVRIHNLRGGWSITQMARMIFGDGDIPDVLAFSVLGWNYRNFACLAELHKQLKPDGVTVFGGNHVSNQGQKVFRECPSVDVVVNGEGELTFRDLTAALLADRREPPLADIAGLSFRSPEDGGCVTTGERERIDDLDVIPSPFLTGAIPLLDRDGHFPYEFALLETNRGCPYKCSFCYWGGATGQRVRSFSRERLAAELDMFGYHEVPTVFLCDANFGMLQADEEFTEDLLRMNEKYGFPIALEANWAKNKSERFHRIVRTLKERGFKSSFTLALQTLSDQALTDMRRRNMKLNQWEELTDWLAEEEMEAFVELIWGAPGETTESFFQGYDKLAEKVPRIAVYPLLLLPNTDYSEQRDIHGFVTVRGQSDDFEYVLANRTSTFDENLRMQRFMYLARILGENQYFKRLWHPARRLAGMTQSQVIHSLLDWIDASDHPSVAAFRDSFPVIAESPAVASGHRMLYSDPLLDRRSSGGGRSRSCRGSRRTGGTRERRCTPSNAGAVPSTSPQAPSGPTAGPRPTASTSARRSPSPTRWQSCSTGSRPGTSPRRMRRRRSTCFVA
ncbi:putative Anaerobic magnesium-protoporphyrin IX monomethyl ester cyclase [Streptomyces afghaniensis 772]|uniref:Putative Anaerobic magnesium-protoporphyrin IX monomethyl ester cyclase n=1 Tax=Streptomyces afghaniensis 772 TaxID=1283301 RepID=S4MA07_9ACTN|nr:KedN5 family methylcobalamin-dependent radical SAM C-methyltransferase [Streptomyces afghaniensis]EPJ36253.1 putative Anaerobic magnesium-protoporphyrin IX monomethyl ester cyclase [Streptomyces afghaniensis 772]